MLFPHVSMWNNSIGFHIDILSGQKATLKTFCQKVSKCLCKHSKANSFHLVWFKVREYLHLPTSAFDILSKQKGGEQFLGSTCVLHRKTDQHGNDWALYQRLLSFTECRSTQNPIQRLRSLAWQSDASSEWIMNSLAPLSTSLTLFHLPRGAAARSGPPSLKVSDAVLFGCFSNCL